MSEVEKLWSKGAREMNDALASDAKFFVPRRSCGACGFEFYDKSHCTKCPKCGASVCEE